MRTKVRRRIILRTEGSETHVVGDTERPCDVLSSSVINHQTSCQSDGTLASCVSLVCQQFLSDRL